MKPQPNPLFDKIRTSKNLPTLPHILLKLIEACNDQNSTVKDISRIIDKDSSLSAKVLRMVNSAHYGLPARITSIEQALLLLGTDAVKNIAVSAAVFQVFGAARGDDVFSLKAFWYHSLLCATTAKLLAREMEYHAPEEAFLAGLLHDIGKMVLWANFPKDYKEVLQSAANEGAGLAEAERQRLGATHAEVGAWMIGRWSLQSFMADAVMYHHEKAERMEDALPLVRIVYLANLLSQESGEKTARNAQTAQRILGVSHEAIRQLTTGAKDQVEEVAQSLGLEISPPGPSDEAATAQQKEVDLLRTVRDASLLQGTLQNLLQVDGETSILAVVKQGLQVLFDTDPVVFLLFDPEKKVLRGKEGLEPARDLLIRELTLSLEMKNALPVRCLEQQTPLDSFGHFQDAALAIIDHQLIRLVQKEGILCLPVIAHRETLGVMVIGIDRGGFAALTGQMSLVMMFVNQCALALYADTVRRTQAKMIQSERLAAASAVARKVVHEANNPLGIIKNYIRIFGLKLPSDDPVQEELKIINEELDRVAFIVRQLSDFSEPEAKQREPVDINRLLTDLVRITGESFSRDSGVRVHLNLDPSVPTVFSEKNGLKQVLINLMKNAVEAMAGGGNLDVSTRYVDGATTDQPREEGKQTSGFVEIRLKDDGPGIPDHIRTRVFEPYVTTKKGQHAGLGLSVAYNIIKDLNGTLSCETGTSHRGTTFVIVLPLGPTF